MEEQFDIRDYKPTGKERDFENALRPLQFEDFSGQDKEMPKASEISMSVDRGMLS